MTFPEFDAEHIKKFARKLG